MPKGHFGAAVIGEEAFEEEREYLLEHRDVYGPAVLDSHRIAEQGGKNEPGPAVVGEAKSEDFYSVSAAKLKSILAANPMEVDGFMRAEFVRPDGMRKTALKALLAAEQDRPGPLGDKAPRAEVISTLEHALASLEG